ncbi:MAG: hypothetical protein U0T32_06080 [Chitinophagales bacterium]
MKSIYSEIYLELIQKKSLSKSEIVTAFYFLLSYNEGRKEKIRKCLLNGYIKDFPELSSIFISHYFLSMRKDGVEYNQVLISKLKIKTILNYLFNSLHSDPHTQNFKSDYLSERGIHITDIIDITNSTGFIFKATFDEVKVFTILCLKLLYELEERLIKLESFKDSINEKYSFKSPKSNAVKAVSTDCYVSDYYINDELEDILIVNIYTSNNDTDSDSYYHISKANIIKIISGTEDDPFVLEKSRYFGEQLGIQIKIQ